MYYPNMFNTSRMSNYLPTYTIGCKPRSFPLFCEKLFKRWCEIHHIPEELILTTLYIAVLTGDLKIDDKDIANLNSTALINPLDYVNNILPISNKYGVPIDISNKSDIALLYSEYLSR